uniref:HNH domain-containing protein n=1 Tax=Chrysotila carterae TaxID=13221 RepID=A0A7S4FBB3_CHRCT
MAPSHRRRRGRRNNPMTAASIAPAEEDLREEVCSLEKAMSCSAIRNELRQLGMKAGSLNKTAMVCRLVRARRAESTIEAGPGNLASPPSRFDSERAGCIEGRLDECRVCARSICPPRRSFCCNECAHSHLLRTDGSYLRKALLVRDAGVCSICQCNAERAYLEVRALLRAARLEDSTRPEEETLEDLLQNARSELRHFHGHARVSSGRGRRRRLKKGSFWQADHVLPVYLGGGSCGLRNLRTLCTPCHASVSARQARDRALGRRHGEAPPPAVAMTVVDLCSSDSEQEQVQTPNLSTRQIAVQSPPTVPLAEAAERQILHLD